MQLATLQVQCKARRRGTHTRHADLTERVLFQRGRTGERMFMPLSGRQILHLGREQNITFICSIQHGNPGVRVAHSRAHARASAYWCLACRWCALVEPGV